MDLLPDTQICGLRMRRECRERFPRHRLQRNPLVSDPGMHPVTCVTHVPRCMSGSLTRSGGENVPGIIGACATRNFAHLVRIPCQRYLARSYLPLSLNWFIVNYEIIAWFINLFCKCFSVSMFWETAFRSWIKSQNLKTCFHLKRYNNVFWLEFVAEKVQ